MCLQWLTIQIENKLYLENKCGNMQTKKKLCYKKELCFSMFKTYVEDEVWIRRGEGQGKD